MVIFMEYCSHGTIEEAARQGLSEDMTRRYTRDILIAIDVLHEHHIIHRDIKGIVLRPSVQFNSLKIVNRDH